MPSDRSSAFLRDLGTVPNLISLSRIAILLVAVALFFADHRLAGTLLAVLAGVTDYLDGYIARRTGQVTRLGEILDQFSDIFFESCAMFIAVAKFQFLPLAIMVVYLLRELWVTSIRRFMAGHQLNISSSFAGKLKTNFIMWGFFPTFLSIQGALPQLEPFMGYLGKFGILGGLVLGYVSGWSYTRQFVAGYNSLAAR